MEEPGLVSNEEAYAAVSQKVFKFYENDMGWSNDNI